MDQRELAVALKEMSVDDIVKGFDLLEEDCKKQMERVYPLPLLLLHPFVRCPYFFPNGLSC